MPFRHTPPNDYASPADLACEAKEKREAKERFDEACLDCGIYDDAPKPCTNPFNPRANAIARQSERLWSK